jgi:hypothetical protein
LTPPPHLDIDLAPRGPPQLERRHQPPPLLAALHQRLLHHNRRHRQARQLSVLLPLARLVVLPSNPPVILVSRGNAVAQTLGATGQSVEQLLHRGAVAKGAAVANVKRSVAIGPGPLLLLIKQVTCGVNVKTEPDNCALLVVALCFGCQA